jgi:chromosome segregation ATPase
LDRAEADEATYVAYFDVDDTALENAKEAKAAIDALNTLLTGDAFKAYTAAYEAYIAAHDANVASATATLKAQHNYDVQDDLATTLANVAAGYTDWAEEINTKEKAINNAEKNIANMTDDGTTTGGYTEASRQAYIDALDVEIARLEKEISIKQAQYDSYMSQVEALINGEETPEVPETPEEGGEETPAE